MTGWRMDNECRDCRWRAPSGHCRRYPPQLIPWTGDVLPPYRYEPGLFTPMVSDWDWCGEFTPKTEKGDGS